MNISFIARPVHTYDREYSSRESYSTTFGQRKCKLRQKKSEVRKKKEKKKNYSKRGRTIVSFCYFDGILDGMVSCRFVFYISFPMISMRLRYDNNRCVTIELCFISGSSTIIVGPILSAHVQTTSGRKARVI